MNIIVFGTGTIYKEQIGKVQDSIVALADNSKYKIGTIIDGNEVISPNDIYKYSYDIIVVMARDKQDIENQLVKLGVKKKYIWQQCNRIYGLTSWDRWTCHYHSKRVILDILAVDQQNRVYNIEIQRNDNGVGVKRARYNSSLIDANVTEPGDQYQELNETYVIFITENDVLGENLSIYHVDRIIRETGKMFNKKMTISHISLL